MKTLPTALWIIPAALVLGIGGYFWFTRGKTGEVVSSFDLGTTPTGGHAPTGPNKVITEPDWNRPFDMRYKKDVEAYIGRPVKGLDNRSARGFAKALKAAKGRFNDDEAVVAHIFGKALKDKVQVAELSGMFYTLYKQDLWQHLTSFLSSSELTRYVRKPLKQLPKYRV